jgi:hypothetical protein
METTTKPSTAGIALKWGAITGLVSIIYYIILQVTGLATNQAMSWLSLVIMIGGMVYGLNEFKKENGGFMTYGEGLGVGTLLSAINGLIYGAFASFYIAFVDDSTMKKTLAIQRQAMEDKGMDDAQIDQAMSMAEKFMGPGPVFLISLLFCVFFGFLLSLVVSAILKKERTELI